jgi:hypothetical protein
MLKVIAIALLAVFALVNIGCHAEGGIGETSITAPR